MTEMEGWKDGRMEGWKDGRMEEWKDGRMEWPVSASVQVCPTGCVYNVATVRLQQCIYTDTLMSNALIITMFIAVSIVHIALTHCREKTGEIVQMYFAYEIRLYTLSIVECTSHFSITILLY